MNAMDGVLSRIMWHKPSKFSRTGSHFLIGKLTNGTVIKGEMDAPKENENYRFYGEMKAQKGRDELAFEFDSFEVLFDQSVAGQVQYLKTYVDGLGFVKSQALVDHFGPDTIAILRTSPERSLEVGGITEKIAGAIAGHFEEVGRRRRFDPVAFARLIDLFSSFRVSKSTIKSLVNLYGSNAPDAILENPYLLLALPRMGWKTVDGFALSIAGYDPNGIERHAGAFMEAFQQLSLDGHTHGTIAELSRIAGSLLAMPPNTAAITKLIGDGEVTTWPGADRASTTFALSKLATAEKRIAELLVRLMKTALPLPTEVSTEGLSPDGQVDAIRMLVEHGVAILCGPPGTGKSYTFTKFLAELINEGVDPGAIRVVAPTGKAAKRVSELLEKHLPPGTVTSSTIHKALAPTPASEGRGIPSAEAKHGRGREGFYFAKNADDPIDAALIVLEEASMVDARLGASFLEAVAPGTRLIIVGDQNQLPPVGPGAFLRDAMAAGIPTVELTKILRSDGGGRVVKACHAIKDGRFPEPATAVELPTENWVHVEIDDQDAIAAKIVEFHKIVQRNGKTDPVWGMQVVSPQNGRLPIACANLNRLLAAVLNPNAIPIEEQADDDSSNFGIGDKVVRTSNGVASQMVRRDGKHSTSDEASVVWRGQKYVLNDTPIVNGDMGQVVDIFDDSKGKPHVVVQFRTPERLCYLPYASCDLIQAYAMTCHKAQGSGFPYVLVPVHEGFYWDHRKGLGLFSREWLYTAISRAETLLVTVGQFSAVRQAVGRQTLHVRRTKLKELIRDSLPGLEPASIENQGVL